MSNKTNSVSVEGGLIIDFEERFSLADNKLSISLPVLKVVVLFN